MDRLEKSIAKQIREIQEEYGDEVTFNSRNYFDKMKWDRIEMLYWLQEERRKVYFQKEIKSKNLSLDLIKDTF